MKKNPVTIRLSQQEIAYLSSAKFLEKHLVEALHSVERHKDSGLDLTISHSLAEEFRDVFTEELAKVGFDQKYDLTPEGHMLENLIDHFYIE